MATPLVILAASLNVAVAIALALAAQFWWRAGRVTLPPAVSLDIRPSFRSLQDYARRIDQRGRLNARAGGCVAVAALLQAVSMTLFLIGRAAELASAA